MRGIKMGEEVESWYSVSSYSYGLVEFIVEYEPDHDVVAKVSTVCTYLHLSLYASAVGADADHDYRTVRPADPNTFIYQCLGKLKP